MIFFNIYIIIFLGDEIMNNFEVIRLLGRMLDVTKEISISTRVHFIKQALVIDKNRH